MITINNECYVSLEIAKLLKELKFDWECRCYYETSGKLKGKNSGSFINYNSTLIWVNNGNTDTQLYSAPTLDVTQRWLREVKNIAVYVCSSYEPIGNGADDKWIMKWQVAAIHYDIESDEINLEGVEEEIFDTYEEALEAGIKKVLEIILE